MSGWTNRGKYRWVGIVLRAVAAPTKFYLALLADTTAPNPDHNVLSDVAEIPAGNGYTAGGQQVNRNSTDFDVYTEDDVNDRGMAQLKNFSWTASGGNLPISGNGARHAALLDDNATPANRELWHYWSLSSNRIISDTQTLTLIDAELQLNET